MSDSQKDEHEKKVKEKHEEIERELENSLEVSEKIIQQGIADDDILDASKKLENIKDKYNNIMSRDFQIDEVSDGLPIESLKDSVEMDKFGKPNKFQYIDLVEASSLKKEGDKILKERDSLIHNHKMSKIELLEAKLKELIKLSEKL